MNEIVSEYLRCSLGGHPALHNRATGEQETDAHTPRMGADTKAFASRHCMMSSLFRRKRALGRHLKQPVRRVCIEGLDGASKERAAWRSGQ